VNTDSPSTDRFEHRLLAAILDDYDNLTAPTGGSQRLSALPASVRHRRPARRMMPAMIATAAAVALAIAGIAATDGYGHASPKAVTQPRSRTSVATRATKSYGPVIQLASYRLRLPTSYQLTAAATTTCPAPVGWVTPGSTPGAWVAVGGVSPAQTPGYAPQMVAAANAEGGCIFMVLAPAYTPTAADPDPEAGTLDTSQPVQVGPYEGSVGTWTSVAEPSNVSSQQVALYVEIPLAGGQDQDLVVGANNLSESALVSIVANGLTVSGSSPT
jgi:hypothetical protein